MILNGTYKINVHWALVLLISLSGAPEYQYKYELPLVTQLLWQMVKKQPFFFPIYKLPIEELIVSQQWFNIVFNKFFYS